MPPQSSATGGGRDDPAEAAAEEKEDENEHSEEFENIFRAEEFKEEKKTSVKKTNKRVKVAH